MGGFCGLLCVLAVCVALLCVPGTNAQMLLMSSAFKNFETIPGKYCCDIVLRDDFKPSPPLEWYRPPSRTQSFVLVMDDMDNNNFVHWLVVDIPRNVTSLVEDASAGLMPEGAMELTNTRGFDSYSGPCPFKEEHRYRVRLFAMPTAHTHINKIEHPDALTSDDIVNQIQDQALYVSVLVGRFYLGEYIRPRTNSTHPHPQPQHRAPSNSTWSNSTASNSTTGGNSTLSKREAKLRASLEHHGHNNQTHNVTRKRTSAEEIPTHRFIKPSEVLKPKRVSHEFNIDNDCEGSAENTAECIVQRAALQADKATHRNASATRHSTQALVTEGVAAFERGIDDWACEEDLRLNNAVRLVGNSTESCSLRARVTDANCKTQQFPRQFVCDPQGKDTSLGQSPSLSWKDSPAQTQSFVVVVEEASDLDYLEDFGHVFWLVADIPATVSSIEAGASGIDSKMPPLSVELRNSFAKRGYTAPCPGPHDHRVYRARVFAMPHRTTKLQLPSQSAATQLRASSLIRQLQREALCMSSVDLTFAFKNAVVTVPRHAQTTVGVLEQVVENEVVPGEEVEMV